MLRTSMTSFLVVALSFILSACSDGGLALKGVDTSSQQTSLSASSTGILDSYDPNELLRIVRSYNPRTGQHILWNEVTGIESNPNGLVIDGTIGRMYRYPGNGRVTLYGCTFHGESLFDGRGYTSNDPNCEGAGYATQHLGAVEPNPTAASPRALYRCWHPGNGDHLDSTNTDECVANGYRVESILGYIN